eukprot:3284985-Prymnesium_polylepis.1
MGISPISMTWDGTMYSGSRSFAAVSIVAAVACVPVGTTQCATSLSCPAGSLSTCTEACTPGATSVRMASISPSSIRSPRSLT